jgi:two-component system, NarL family, sensor kinase
LNTARNQLSFGPEALRNPTKLRERLAEAEETIRAIRSGEVDAVIVAGKKGSKVFTLEGAEHAYRMLIESMNEGALELAPDKTILYSNASFARMVKHPLEQVMGSSFRRFLSVEHRRELRRLMKRANRSGAKTLVTIIASDGSNMPAQISVQPLPRNGFAHAVFGVVVTDMTEARRNEEQLRALTRRVVHAQEEERGRVAFELHDNITQLLCAVVFQSQALTDKLSRIDDSPKQEAMRLCDMVGKIADEVERISANLGPSLLEHLGLGAVLRAARAEIASRTGLLVKLTYPRSVARLSAEVELALYRIFQEALRNVTKHARARHVAVHFNRQDSFVQMVINDDGVGFDPDHRPVRRRGIGGLGLLSMQERAAYVGGSLKVKSSRHAGTQINVRIPLT